MCAALEGTFAQTAEGQSDDSNAPRQDFAQFERDLGRVCAQLQIPGAVAGIVSEGQLVWSHAYDQAFQGRVADRPYASLVSLFPIASVSKTMAAAILMRLVDEGRVRLDDPITKYHPELQLPNTVTLERLLSHTSEDVPGEEFLYSSQRYALLTGAVERVTHKPYAQVLDERIFHRLGMQETLAGRDAGQGAISDALRGRIAPPFEFDPQTRTAIPAEAPGPRVTAATGVITTLGDLAKYAEALRGRAPAIVPQQAKEARQLARDALVARAWMQFYLGDADNSARFLELCLQQYPELGLPRETEMLYLLVHLRRPELRSATAEIGGALLEIHPALAPVLYYDGLAEQQAGREERAETLWKRVCNEWPSTQHWSVGEACLEAGQSYAAHDLRLARFYLERAIVAGSGDTPDVARRLVAKLPAAH